MNYEILSPNVQHCHQFLCNLPEIFCCFIISLVIQAWSYNTYCSTTCFFYLTTSYTTFPNSTYCLPCSCWWLHGIPLYRCAIIYISWSNSQPHATPAFQVLVRNKSLTLSAVHSLTKPELKGELQLFYSARRII